MLNQPRHSPPNKNRSKTTTFLGFHEPILPKMLSVIPKRRFAPPFAVRVLTRKHEYFPPPPPPFLPSARARMIF